MTHSKRRELIRQLRESDPDYVVDVLGVTSNELLAAFPRQLSDFLDGEVGAPGWASEEPTTFDEIDEEGDWRDSQEDETA
jgi:hypothetical protein